MMSTDEGSQSSLSKVGDTGVYDHFHMAEDRGSGEHSTSENIGYNQCHFSHGKQRSVAALVQIFSGGVDERMLSFPPTHADQGRSWQQDASKASAEHVNLDSQKCDNSCTTAAENIESSFVKFPHHPQKMVIQTGKCNLPKIKSKPVIIGVGKKNNTKGQGSSLNSVRNNSSKVKPVGVGKNCTGFSKQMLDSHTVSGECSSVQSLVKEAIVHDGTNIKAVVKNNISKFSKSEVIADSNLKKKEPLACKPIFQKNKYQVSEINVSSLDEREGQTSFISANKSTLSKCNPPVPPTKPAFLKTFQEKIITSNIVPKDVNDENISHNLLKPSEVSVLKKNTTCPAREEIVIPSSLFLNTNQENPVQSGSDLNVLEDDYEIPETPAAVHMVTQIASSNWENDSRDCHSADIFNKELTPSLSEPQDEQYEFIPEVDSYAETQEETYLIPSLTPEETLQDSSLPTVNLPSSKPRLATPPPSNAVAEETVEDAEESPGSSGCSSISVSSMQSQLSVQSTLSDKPAPPPKRVELTPPPLPSRQKAEVSLNNQVEENKRKWSFHPFKKRLSGSGNLPASSGNLANTKPVIEKEKFIFQSAITKSPYSVNVNQKFPEKLSAVPSSEQKTCCLSQRPLPAVPVSAAQESKETVVQSKSVDTSVVSGTELSVRLLNFPWFHPVDRHQAEELVSKGINGTFLVRESKHGGANNPYTLTLWYDLQTYHISIRKRLDGKYALGFEKQNELSFGTIEELVARHQVEVLKLHRGHSHTGTTCLVGWPSKDEAE